MDGKRAKSSRIYLSGRHSRIKKTVQNNGKSKRQEERGPFKVAQVYYFEFQGEAIEPLLD